MLMLRDLRKDTVTSLAAANINKDALVTMDASHSHSGIEEGYRCHCEKMLTQKEIDRELPWVHTVISNAKSLFLDTYHGTKDAYMQDYLSEFCWKFNRRYFGERLFDRLLDISVGYRNTFEHRIYNKSLEIAG